MLKWVSGFYRLKILEDKDDSSDDEAAPKVLIITNEQPWLFDFPRQYNCFENFEFDHILSFFLNAPSF